MPTFHRPCLGEDLFHSCQYCPECSVSALLQEYHYSHDPYDLGALATEVQFVA